MHIIGETLVVFGGCYLDIACFNDLYMFDIRYSFIANKRTKTWSFPKSFGSPPTPRSGHSSFLNGAKIYIFGGNTL
jgi:hypothetical protein